MRMRGRLPTALVAERLSSIEDQLKALNSQLSLASPPPRATTESFKRVQVHFTRTELERRPFAMTVSGLEGRTLALSSVRTAILVTLLLDLQDRSEGGTGLSDLVTIARDTVRALNSDDTKASEESVRVAAYRAAEFIESEFLKFVSPSIELKFQDGRLHLPAKKKPVRIELSSQDDRLAVMFNSLVSISPIERVRRSQALFLPPGNEGHDSLLLHLFDHPNKVVSHSLFYRPTIQSFPLPLLQKLKMSDARIRRHQVAQRGFSEGRIEFTEILNRSTLDQLITRIPGKGFGLYAGVTPEDVLAHVDYLIQICLERRGYNLVLTDAPFPFYLTLWKLGDGSNAEHFLLFFQKSLQQELTTSCFALKNESVFLNIQQNVVNWILQHPTTVRERSAVADELHALRSQFLASDSFH
jgi:hypothetical protein